MSEYVKSGMAPLIIGTGLIVLGSISILSALGDRPVINTPGSKGFDMLASVAVCFVGYAVFKSKSSLSAWLSLCLAASLVIYANVSVDSKQAAHIALAAVNASKAAASTAAVNMTNVSGKTIPNGYRELTDNEIIWCKKKGRENLQECQIGYCKIKKCKEVK